MQRKTNRLLLLLISTALAACSTQSERGSSGLETEVAVVPSTVQPPPPEPEAIQYTEAELVAGDLGPVDETEETVSYAEEDFSSDDSGISEPEQFAEEFPITTYEVPVEEEIGDLGAVDQSSDTLSYEEEYVYEDDSGISGADEYVIEEEVTDLGAVDEPTETFSYQEEYVYESTSGIGAADEYVIEDEVADLGAVDEPTETFTYQEEYVYEDTSSISAADEYVIEDEVADLGTVDTSDEMVSFEEEYVYQEESVGSVTSYESVTFNSEAQPLFAFDKDDVRENEHFKLESLVTDLAGAEFETIWVVGHADRIGNVAYNQGLSERRAGSVKAVLVRLGIDGGKVNSEGRSNLQPITTEMDCDGLRGDALLDCYQPDRRVEVTVSAEVVQEVLN
jgi:outer membrane protein OmpA-like peptidoglycan-associated protein